MVPAQDGIGQGPNLGRLHDLEPGPAEVGESQGMRAAPLSAQSVPQGSEIGKRGPHETPRPGRQEGAQRRLRRCGALTQRAQHVQAEVAQSGQRGGSAGGGIGIGRQLALQASCQALGKDGNRRGKGKGGWTIACMDRPPQNRRWHVQGAGWPCLLLPLALMRSKSDRKKVQEG